MRAVLDIILIVINMYQFILIAAAILSWLIAFGVVNTRNEIVRAVGDVTYRLTEPLLAPIRRYVPAVGGLDLSFVVLYLGTIFVTIVITRYIYPYVF
jgi:YggT family protein